MVGFDGFGDYLFMGWFYFDYGMLLCVIVLYFIYVMVNGDLCIYYFVLDSNVNMCG